MNRRMRWYWAHLEKSKAISANWKAANPEKARAYLKKWKAEHPERIRAIDKKYAATHKEKKRATNAQGYAKHRKERIAYSARWNAAHPEVRRHLDAARRAKIRGTAVGLTKEERAKIVEIYRQCRLMTKLTGMQFHVDHVIAISKGGKHHPDNLQLLTATENSKKGCR